jgi:hypothetical protein
MKSVTSYLGRCLLDLDIEYKTMLGKLCQCTILDTADTPLRNGLLVLEAKAHDGTEFGNLAAPAYS